MKPQDPQKAQKLTAAEASGRLALDFADLAQTLWAQDSESAVLQKVSQSTVASVPGAAAVSITFRRRGGRWETAAPTASFAGAVDSAQYRADEGPCVDTVRTGRFHVANDLSTETRWPRFCQVALGHGVAGVLSLDLQVVDYVFGSLNIYSSHPGALGRRSELIGRMHATHASLAIAASRQSDALQREVGARSLLGEAIGVLMERHHLTNAQALRRLQQTAKDHGLDLLQVARRVVSSATA